MQDEAERVYRHPLQNGHILAHLAAKTIAFPGERTAISIVWLVPASDSPIGHEIVAEVLTALYEGSHAGEVEGVSVRFAADWTDWTASQPDEYFRADATTTFKIPLPTEGDATAQDILGKVWAEIFRLFQGECSPKEKEMVEDGTGRGSLVEGA